METHEGTMITNELSCKRRALRNDGSSPDGETITVVDEEPITVVGEREMVNVVLQNDASLTPKQIWLNSIMKRGVIGLANKSVIQKVPQRLRNIQSNGDCFDPMVISIGPYHHGKPELQDMEKFKELFTKMFVESSKSSVHLLFEEVEKLFDAAKNCYVEGSMDKFGRDDFSKMMFLDGCFILQFMVSYPKKDKLLETGMKAHEIAFVQRDLFFAGGVVRKRIGWTQYRANIMGDEMKTHTLTNKNTSFNEVRQFRLLLGSNYGTSLFDNKIQMKNTKQGLKTT